MGNLSEVSGIPYKSYKKLKEEVMLTLIYLIKRARGSCVTFTSKKIAILSDYSPQPVLLTIIRDILEELCNEGLISRYSKGSHGIKYIITSKSLLWQLIKNKSFKDVNIASPTLSYAIEVLENSIERGKNI